MAPAIREQTRPPRRYGLCYVVSPARISFHALWGKLVVCARTPCPELGHDALGRPNLQRHINGGLVAVVKLVVYVGGKRSFDPIGCLL